MFFVLGNGHTTLTCGTYNLGFDFPLSLDGNTIPIEFTMRDSWMVVGRSICSILASTNCIFAPHDVHVHSRRNENPLISRATSFRIG